MKTTILFKMCGAWSPLWQLSKEKSFVIKSHDFWTNVVCGLDIVKQFQLQPYQEAFMDLATTAHHVMDAVGYPCSNQLKEQHYDKGTAKEMNYIYFNEYSDPCNFSATASEHVAMDKMFNAAQLGLKMDRRAQEIYGIWNEREKLDFVQQASIGYGLIIVRKTDEGFSLQLRKCS